MQGLNRTTALTGAGDARPCLAMTEARMVAAGLARDRGWDEDVAESLIKVLGQDNRGTSDPERDFGAPRRVLKLARAGRYEFRNDAERLCVSLANLWPAGHGKPSILDVLCLCQMAIGAILDCPDPREKLRRAAAASYRLSRQTYSIPPSTIRHLKGLSR